MHIPDGHINAVINTLTYLISIGTCAYAIKKLSRETSEMRIPLLAVASVFILLIQLINFPIIKITASHFIGAVLLAALVGPWAGCLIIALVLIIHQLVLGYGGLASLGANIFNLGIIGATGGYYALMRIKKLFPHNNKGYLTSLFIVSFGSVIIINLFFYIQLSASNVEIVLGNLLSAAILIGILEANITVGLVYLIVKARPDLVITHCCGGDKESCYSHHHHVKTHKHKAGKENEHGHVY